MLLNLQWCRTDLSLVACTAIASTFFLCSSRFHVIFHDIATVCVLSLDLLSFRDLIDLVEQLLHHVDLAGALRLDLSLIVAACFGFG